MKHLYSVLLGICLGVTSSTAQPTVWAYRSFQPYDKADVTGPIRFQADDPENVTLISDQSKLGHVYAGTYYNYKWYCQVTHVGTQTTIDGLYCFDMNDGTRTFVAPSNRALSDMTHDYSTGKTYGIANGAANLATIDLNTGTVVLGAALTKGENAPCYMVAIAADLDGTLYGVSTDNCFYSIDKTTGACTLIGNTGRDVAYTQTMAFDHNNHVLYWVNNGDYRFYTIDIATGKSTYLGYTDSYNALAIPYIHAAKGAPDRVTGRKATAQGTTVTLEWTNPTIDAQGHTLTALDGVKIYRDGSLIATVPAAQVTYTDENVPAGPHHYKLVPFNDKGDGGADSDDVNTQVGPNPPGAVQNFTVTPGNYNAVLSWQAPTQGMYGGEFDPESITLYQITRVNGATRATFSIKAPNTTYTDKPGFGTYTYIIKAINDQGNGVETESQPVMVKYDNWIVMGNGEVSIPNDTKFKFYDNGATGYYTNSVDYTMTIKPSEASSIVSAKFSQFNLDTYGDTLFVYDGVDTKAPFLGKYTDIKVPAALSNLRATNKQGALTFRFTSDIIQTATGWLAEVVSTKLKSHDLEAGALSGSPRPTAREDNAYQLTINNLSMEDVMGSNYTVALLDDNNTVLASTQGVDIPALKSGTVQFNYTPAQAGDLNLHATINYTADEDATNNTAAPLPVSILPNGSKYVTIATPGSVVYIYPASFYSNESVWETVYDSEMIGMNSGQLTMMSFPMQSTKNYTSVPVTIYVGETTESELKEHCIYASALTKVFEGNVPIRTTSKEWVFTLDTPYEYKGGNLVIMMHKVAPGTNSQGITFGGTYGNTGDPFRTRAASTYYDTDHLDLEADFGWPTTSLPDVNLLFMGKSSGMTSIDAGRISFMVQDRTVTVAGACGQPVTVYTPDGRTVAHTAHASSMHTIALPHAGAYIIKAANETTKVIVK
ncbi:MAG: DUF6383 domain-containing protein [Muribaculaceae bacterium]|nr:DUF6383 domain-containing protein [Muribaculaceae bacterium]